MTNDQSRESLAECFDSYMKGFNKKQVSPQYRCEEWANFKTTRKKKSLSPYKEMLHSNKMNNKNYDGLS